MPATVDQVPSTALQRIEAAALQLAPEQRAELAERLWASVDGGDEAALDPAWEAEIKRRMQEVDKGSVQCRPWDEVISELRAKHQA